MSFKIDTNKYPNGPCEALFEELAETDPANLFELLPTLNDPLLSKAAEILGNIKTEPYKSQAIMTLFNLVLYHPTCYVREGAIYGLEGHKANTAVPVILNTVRKTDINETIREIAEEALEYLF